MKNIKFILFALLGTFLFSCEQPEIVEFSFDGTTDALFETKLGGRADVFYEAVKKAGYQDRLSGGDNFTYLAPNNAAMLVALEDAGFNSVAEADVEFLQNLVDDHMLSDIVLAGDLSKTSVSTISGEMVYVSVEGGIAFNAKAGVSEGNNVTSNGVVHIIDYPLIDFPTQTIAEIVVAAANAAEGAEFTILLAALQTADLAGTLGSTESLFTVFAPTDAAFTAAGFDATSITQVDPTVLTEILLFHVLPGRNFTTDLVDGRYYTLNGDAESGVKGLDIDIESGNSGLTIDARIDDAETVGQSINLLATNGTIHVVDEVIFPEYYTLEAIGPDSEVGFAFLWADFYDSMINSEIDTDSLFRGDSIFTILPYRFESADPVGTIEERLLGHTFKGNLDIAAAAVAGTVITSVNGRRYFVTRDFNNRPFVNGRTGIQRFTDGVIIINSTFYNGRVTGIVSELVPLPDISAATAIEEEVEAESLFAAALSFLELDSLANVTYLHVPNAVFGAVYEDAGIDADISQLEEADAAVLEEEINKYILSSVFFSRDLVGEAEYTDRNGDIVSIVDIAGGEFGIKTLNNNDQVVVIPFDEDDVDILYSNGVIHSIGSLL